MPAQKIQPTSYVVYLAPQNIPSVVAHINCIVDEQVEGGVKSTIVFQVYFIAAGNPLLPNGPNDIKAPADELVWYLDLLRNERYVFARIDADNPQSNALYASGTVGWGHVS